MAQIMHSFNDKTIEFHGIDTASDRLAELANWLSQVLDGAVLQITPASNDASFRRYYRAVQVETARGVTNGGASATHSALQTSAQNRLSWVIMDAPASQESTAPFQRICERLYQAGVHVPKIYAWNEALGFMLLEDFGQTTLLAQRQAQKQASLRSYKDAIDTLCQIQANAPTTDLPVYDNALLRKEMELFRHWLVLRHLGLSWSTQDEHHWQETMEQLCTDAQQQERVFVHRDYHSRNLMVIGQSPASGLSDSAVSARNPGVLDFQDAVFGPIFYDLVSLLKDCYATPADTWLEQQLAYYFKCLSHTSLSTTDTTMSRRLFHSMGMQRHLKAAGIFARLWHRDGKPAYLQDIPRTLSYVVHAARADSRFGWLADYTERVLRVLPEGQISP